MKKLFASILTLCTLSGIGKAQVVDFNFDNPWASGNPAGWVSGDVLNPLVVERDTSVKHFGPASARIKTVAIPGASSLTNGIVPDTSGVLITGTLILFPTQTVKIGYPYTQRQDSLGFFYRYDPVGSDTAFAGVALTKVRPGTDTLAFGLKYLNSTGGAWQVAYVKLDYQPGVGGAEIPDTAIIAFSSSTITNFELNSTLWIDDLQWGAINMGTQSSSYDSKVLVYPNPAQNVLKMDLGAGQKDVIISISDAAGRKVFEHRSYQQIQSIDITDWNKGMYFFTLTQDNGTVISRGKFTIQR